MTSRLRSALAAPLWASPFRPFYFLGATYALVLAALQLVSPTMGILLPADAAKFWWHGHEMIFGFAAAIVSGISLTALPSWAGTAETDRGRLALLVALWCAGRLAWWFDALPLLLRATLDASHFALAAGLIGPGLWRADNRQFRWLLAVFAAFVLAQIVFYLALARADDAGLAQALRLGVYALMLLYTLKGGVLTPTFTANALRERGLSGLPAFLLALEVACALAIVGLALGDLLALPPYALSAIALGAAVLILLRSLRWQPWRVLDLPLLATMHAGFLFFVLALLLLAASLVDPRVSREAWLHSFTVGSLGFMMLSLMTRVSLRHTGRAIQTPGIMRFAFLCILFAALARLLAAFLPQATALMKLAMIFWALPFALYLWRFGRVLLSPSEPRARNEAEAAALKRETPPAAANTTIRPY